MKKITSVLLLSLFVLACKKENTISPPTITSISPTSGVPDTNVTINGSNFTSSSTSNKVKFNGVDAEVVSATSTSIVAKVPISAGTGPITISTPQGTATSPDFTYIPDVFVGGAENNSNGNYVIKFWKNGLANVVTDGSFSSFAYSMVVSGTDIYFAGYQIKNSVYVATVWKNGTALSLTDGTHDAIAFSVAVAGNDIHVVGQESNGTIALLKYWKNGTSVSIGDGVSPSSARAVVITGNDIFIAGEEQNKAKYWKNGLATSLSDGLNSASTSSIAISGNDVYVSGMVSDGTNYYGQYWKNGAAVILPNNVNLNIDKLIIVNNDVYLSGNLPGAATYWKNNVPTSLPINSKPSFAHSITVYENDVYVAGNDFNGKVKIAKYWKNGTAITLTDGLFDAHAWAVVVR